LTFIEYLKIEQAEPEITSFIAMRWAGKSRGALNKALRLWRNALNLCPDQGRIQALAP